MDCKEEKNDEICISKIKLKYKIKQDEEELIFYYLFIISLFKMNT